MFSLYRKLKMWFNKYSDESVYKKNPGDMPDARIEREIGGMHG